MTIASIFVDDTILDHFDLPEGFRQIWERRVGIYENECTIEGPFPPDVEDGSKVKALISTDDGKVFLQWATIDNWTPIGEKLELKRL